MRTPRSDRAAGPADAAGSGPVGSGGAPDDSREGAARGCPIYPGVMLAEVAFEFATAKTAKNATEREPDPIDRAIADAIDAVTWSP